MDVSEYVLEFLLGRFGRVGLGSRLDEFVRGDRVELLMDLELYLGVRISRDVELVTVGDLVRAFGGVHG